MGSSSSCPPSSSPGTPDAARPAPRCTQWVGPGFTCADSWVAPPSRQLPKVLGALTPLCVAARPIQDCEPLQPRPLLCSLGGQPALVSFYQPQVAADLLGYDLPTPPQSPKLTSCSAGAVCLCGEERGGGSALEPRGLNLFPQCRGEDVLADQLHDQRLPGRVYPYSVSAWGWEVAGAGH